jgi:antitoxin component YwqK of YwqJK toxin-antitoxin module
MRFILFFLTLSIATSQNISAQKKIWVKDTSYFNKSFVDGWSDEYTFGTDETAINFEHKVLEDGDYTAFFDKALTKKLAEFSVSKNRLQGAYKEYFKTGNIHIDATLKPITDSTLVIMWPATKEMPSPNVYILSDGIKAYKDSSKFYDAESAGFMVENCDYNYANSKIKSVYTGSYKRYFKSGRVSEEGMYSNIACLPAMEVIMDGETNKATLVTTFRSSFYYVKTGEWKSAYAEGTVESETQITTEKYSDLGLNLSAN